MKQLVEIQNSLKVQKNRENKFGKYKYRSLEDILEALKPLLHTNKCFLVIKDEMVMIGERYYLKATVEIHNDEGQLVTTSAMAREAITQAGMSDAQVTGSTSSYARKYALNGLFAIDDTKDDDEQEQPQPPQPPKAPQPPRTINQVEGELLMALVEELGTDLERLCANYKVNMIGEMTLEKYQDAIKKLTAKKAKQ